jgi:hypothetical protein
LPPVRQAAGFLGLLALGFGVGSWSLGYWIQGVPGPGLLPLGTSILLLPTAIYLFRAPLEPGDEPSLAVKGLVGFALCAACASVMPSLGIAIPGAALALLWMRFFGSRSWVSAGLISVAIIAGLYGLFVLALKVPMPMWPNAQ